MGNNVYLANVANTYSGATAIGTPQLGGFVDIGAIAALNVSKLANGGLPSSVGASTSNASNLVFNSGSGGLATLAYVGGGRQHRSPFHDRQRQRRDQLFRFGRR